MVSLTRRLVWSLAALAALVLLGTAGYVVIEDPPLDDALYMTVITLTAVGYEEVWELTAAGRAFTMFLLLAGISWLGFWFASITALIVELDLKDVLMRRRSMKEIANMKDHIIVCGAGRTGRQVAKELERHGGDYVVVEHDPDRIKELHEEVPEAHAVEGDATHDQVLLDVGLQQARGLISCLSADADNLYVCLSARELASDVAIVARAYEEESVDKLYRAGATHVVSPNVSGAIRMASVLLRPAVISLVDVATRSPELKLRMEQASVTASSRLNGRTLAEAQIPTQTGLIVIAVGKPDNGALQFQFNPSADTRVDAGDEIIVLGNADQIERLKTYIG